MSDQERGRRPQDLPGGGDLPEDLVAEEADDYSDGLAVLGASGKKMRTVRVGDGLWDAAAELAAAKGTTLAAVIRGLLVDYVRRERRRS